MQTFTDLLLTFLVTFFSSTKLLRFNPLVRLGAFGTFSLITRCFLTIVLKVSVRILVISLRAMLAALT